jgi:hypothetical protein
MRRKSVLMTNALGKKRTPMTKGKPGALTGEVIWPSYREKWQSSPAALRG